jgi:hypothetical protein
VSLRRSLRRGTVAALAAAALVAGCGDDEDSAPEIGVSAAPYEVTLPDGWREGTEEEKEQLGLQAGAAVEEAAGEELELPDVGLTSLWLRGEPALDTPSAVVIREPIPDGVEPERFVSVSLENAERAFADQLVGATRQAPDSTVAGEAAPTYDYRIRFGNRELAKRAVFIIRDGDAYTLTLTTTPPDFDGATAELDEILASWTWSD